VALYVEFTILIPAPFGEYPCQYCQQFTVLECMNCESPVCKSCEGVHIRAHRKEVRE
jgi:hypothetical protein